MVGITAIIHVIRLRIKIQPKKHPQAIVNFRPEGAFILFLCWRESETYISVIILEY